MVGNVYNAHHVSVLACQLLLLVGNGQASLTLPDTVLLPLRSMTVLRIEYSGLTNLPQLDSMTGLIEAHLRLNQLTELAPLAFANKPQLQWVYLLGNKLTTVPVNCFANCTRLRKLDIESNELAHLPPDVFRTLHGLIDVRLSHNQLTSVPERLFVNSPLVKDMYVATPLPLLVVLYLTCCPVVSDGYNTTSWKPCLLTSSHSWAPCIECMPLHNTLPSPRVAGVVDTHASSPPPVAQILGAEPSQPVE